MKTDLHNKGTWSEVLGMMSAMRSWNTVKDRRTVIPSDIFSPSSGGTQNIRRASKDRMVQGVTIVLM